MSGGYRPAVDRVDTLRGTTPTPMSGGQPLEVRPYTSMVAHVRMVLLYLVSRRYAHSLLAIGVLATLVWWVMGRTPTEPTMGVDIEMVTARNETLLLHLGAALLASVIGMAVWTPFGETERVSPIVLPVMRGAHLLSLVGIGTMAMLAMISSWSDVIPGVSLPWLFVRNTVFLVGCVLLVGRIVDIRLSWLVPILFGGVTIVGLLQRIPRIERVEELWQGSSWNVLALDQTSGLANAVCVGVGIGAIAVYIRDGVRDTDEAE